MSLLSAPSVQIILIWAAYMIASEHLGLTGVFDQMIWRQGPFISSIFWNQGRKYKHFGEQRIRNVRKNIKGAYDKSNFLGHLNPGFGQ